MIGNYKCNEEKGTLMLECCDRCACRSNSCDNIKSYQLLSHRGYAPTKRNLLQCYVSRTVMLCSENVNIVYVQLILL